MTVGGGGGMEVEGEEEEEKESRRQGDLEEEGRVVFALLRQRGGGQRLSEKPERQNEVDHDDGSR